MAAVPAQALVISDGAVLPPQGSSSTTGWSLAGDYLAEMNPNGPWSYGRVSSSGAFSLLSWNAGTDSYGIAAVDQVFVYKNMAGAFDFGIDPSKFSLQSDWGNAAVRWIAPSSGAETFKIAIGSSTVSGVGGFGNNFAPCAALVLDGAERVCDSFSSNVRQWNLSQYPGAGCAGFASVLNPGFAPGGNTQKDTSISAVPELASVLLLGPGTGVLACLRRRSAT